MLDAVLRPLWRRSWAGREISIDDLVRDLRARITDVVRHGWVSMTFGLVGFFGVYYVLFWFCLHAVGVHVSFGQIFAAYAVGRLLTAVGITPGGVGVTESGTAAVLVAWGAEPAGALAGVVLFSVYTHLMEIPLGAIGWVAWGLSRKHQPPPTRTGAGVLDASRLSSRRHRRPRCPHRASPRRRGGATPGECRTASRRRRARGRRGRTPSHRRRKVSRRAAVPGAAAPGRRRSRPRPPARSPDRWPGARRGR